MRSKHLILVAWSGLLGSLAALAVAAWLGELADRPDTPAPGCACPRVDAATRDDVAGLRGEIQHLKDLGLGKIGEVEGRLDEVEGRLDALDAQAKGAHGLRRALADELRREASQAQATFARQVAGLGENIVALGRRLDDQAALRGQQLNAERSARRKEVARADFNAAVAVALASEEQAARAEADREILGRLKKLEDRPAPEPVAIERTIRVEVPVFVPVATPCPSYLRVPVRCRWR